MHVCKDFRTTPFSTDTQFTQFCKISHYLHIPFCNHNAFSTNEIKACVLELRNCIVFLTFGKQYIYMSIWVKLWYKMYSQYVITQRKIQMGNKTIFLYERFIHENSRKETYSQKYLFWVMVIKLLSIQWRQNLFDPHYCYNSLNDFPTFIISRLRC